MISRISLTSAAAAAVTTSSEVTTESDNPAEPDLLCFRSSLANPYVRRVPARLNPGEEESLKTDHHIFYSVNSLAVLLGIR